MASGTQAAMTRKHEVTVYNKSLGFIVKRIHRIFRSKGGNLFCTYLGKTYQLKENDKGYYLVA